MDTKAPVWFVAIGASGSAGLEGVKRLLASLSPKLDAVILVVLHRPWDKPTRLRDVLARASTHPVRIADEDERFIPGTVYIGEPDQHLTLALRSFGKLVDDPERRYSNRTIDLLFASLAENAGARALGVVLAGSLDDGSRGLAAIHAEGGLTMVLTPDTSTLPGMPESAIAYDGPIDVIGSPEDIAQAIEAAVAG